MGSKMTSTVKVTAHCSDDKHVEVSLNGETQAVIQNGESKDFYVYDDREISVKEVLKAE